MDPKKKTTTSKKLVKRQTPVKSKNKLVKYVSASSVPVALLAAGLASKYYLEKTKPKPKPLTKWEKFLDKTGIKKQNKPVDKMAGTKAGKILKYLSEQNPKAVAKIVELTLKANKK